MRNKIVYWIIPLVFFIASGCEEMLIEEEFKNTPVDNYDAFWSEFDRFYGDFDVKNINWDSLKTVYSEGLTESSSDQQLFHSLTGLLNELNDGHADLYAPGIGYFRSWNRRNKSYFGDEVNSDVSTLSNLNYTICKHYLNNRYEEGIYSDWKFYYGTINYKSYKIGYISIPTFSNDDYPVDFIQQAVDSFNKKDAVIIDLRYNGGGRTDAFMSTLNSFASEKRVYLKSKFRNGKNHSDFTAMAEHSTNPHENGLRNKPIAILMNSFSASSSDHFILGMKSQADVITVGDTTCGAFSAVLERILPNGWKFRLGAQVVYNPDGSLMTDSHGNYLEGIGIAPDFWVQDELRMIRNGVDMPLEKALKKITENLQ